MLWIWNAVAFFRKKLHARYNILHVITKRMYTREYCRIIMQQLTHILEFTDSLFAIVLWNYHTLHIEIVTNRRNIKLGYGN